MDELLAQGLGRKGSRTIGSKGHRAIVGYSGNEDGCEVKFYLGKKWLVAIPHRVIAAM